MRMIAPILFVGLALSVFATAAWADGYPDATVDQVTVEVKNSLEIGRYEQLLYEEALQAEYEWALRMARLCLENPHVLLRDNLGVMAIEFQRHAGRTARFRGFIEAAISDYETAIKYVDETVRLLVGYPKSFYPPDQRGWVTTIYRDIADAYLLVGAGRARNNLQWQNDPPVLLDLVECYTTSWSSATPPVPGCSQSSPIRFSARRRAGK